MESQFHHEFYPSPSSFNYPKQPTDGHLNYSIMQPHTQQYQEPIPCGLPTLKPDLLAGAINGIHLYNQLPTRQPTNVIQPILTAPETNVPTPIATTTTHKRRSIELEDDSMIVDEPPSKQLLSEKNLFKKFGSLQIGGSGAAATTAVKLKDDDDDDDEEPRSRTVSSDSVAQEEFNRYVYLLFKDIESSSPAPFEFSNSNSPIDRLVREERDKLSKAVILWSPPIGNRFCSVSDSDEENTELETQDDMILAD